MRNIKSFLVSGMTLCVLYLIVHSTFFSTDSVDDTQAQGKKIYSPFMLSSAMDAEHTEVEEEHHDDARQQRKSIGDAAAAEQAPTEQPAAEPAPEQRCTSTSTAALHQTPAAPAAAPAARTKFPPPHRQRL